MSFYTPNGKRRRLEQASSALSKPFKSPLRRETPTVKEEALSPKLDRITAAGSSQQSSSSINQNSQSTSSKSRSTTSLPPPPTRKRTLLSVGRLTPSNKLTPTPPDTELSALQKTQRDLQSRLLTLRTDLDTLQQALRIESSNRDEELQGLILKWKNVSQEAAEEVFTGAQERISRMGGVKSWRKNMRSDDARWGQEEMENWFGNVDGRDLEFDEDEIESRKAEIREEMERQTEKRDGKGEEVEAEPEEFTMDMMLKTLNIELATVGYDKAGQRWIKE